MRTYLPYLHSYPLTELTASCLRSSPIDPAQLPPPVPTVSSTVSTETIAPPPALPPAPPPPPPKLVYDKSIQTSSSSDPSFSTQTDPSSSSLSSDPSSLPLNSSAGRETADELRARIISELETERLALDAEIAREKALAQAQLDSSLARGLPASQLSSVFSSPGFVDFLEESSKIVQRALSDPYDYLRDYTVTEEEGREEKEGREKGRVRLLGSWKDEKGWGRGRSVTGVDWSPKVRYRFASFSLRVC